jgi:catalase (peroxidase I)
MRLHLLLLFPAAVVAITPLQLTLLVKAIRYRMPAPDAIDRGDFVGAAARLLFHDAGTWDGQSTGGPDGCLLRNDTDNRGLETILAVADALESEYSAKYDIGRTDIWALLGLVAISDSMPIGTNSSIDLLNTFHVGRKVRNSCSSDHGVLPSAHGGIEEIERVFKHRLGLTPGETVALMGAHSLGTCKIENSGFIGPWDNSPAVLDNHYFRNLLFGKYVNAW